MTSTTWLSFQPTRICSENINGPGRAQKLEQVPKRGSNRPGSVVHAERGIANTAAESIQTPTAISRPTWPSKGKLCRKWPLPAQLINAAS